MALAARPGVGMAGSNTRPKSLAAGDNGGGGERAGSEP
jgi:hypothetical protein